MAPFEPTPRPEVPDPQSLAKQFIDGLKKTDWLAVVKPILKQNWPEIQAAVDALVKDQPLRVRIAWALAKGYVAAWLAAD